MSQPALRVNAASAVARGVALAALSDSQLRSAQTLEPDSGVADVRAAARVGGARADAAHARAVRAGRRGRL